jgi:hypothetical protein
MRNLSQHDLGAIGRRILLGNRLTLSQRRAGFTALARDVDEAAAVAAVWLMRAGSTNSAAYALQFERTDSWHCLGWSGGSTPNLLLIGRPSAASGPAKAIELSIGGSSRSRLGKNSQAAASHTDVAGRADWIACAGFRVAADAETLQVGERLINVPDHGYVVVAWRSPDRLARPPISALRKDGSPLATIGPNEHLDSLGWKSVLTVLDDESPPGP